MTRRKIRPAQVVWTACLALLLLAACSGMIPAPASTDAPATTSDSTSTETPTATRRPGSAAPSATSATPSGPVTLRIWLPPQFDPATTGAAGKIFQERLQEFSSRRADVRVEVRIKALDGQGGLLDSLAAASAAAPLALPDLIALPRSMLEAAALKGYLHAYEAQSGDLNNADWYPYAQQLGRVQDSTFGLPFGGDALALAYRSELVEQPPASLAEALNSGSALAFPAADPQALVTLAFYQAIGGELLDEQSRPMLQADRLEQILELYAAAARSETLPLWTTQIQNDEQAWEAFQDGQAALAVTWASRLLKRDSEDANAVLLPTSGEAPFTLASGWVWALASANPEHQRLSTQLALFLSEGEFSGRWMAAAGYLPVRQSALEQWEPSAGRSLARQIVPVAQLVPNTDVLSSLGPLLEQAVVAVLKQQQGAREAAESAAQALGAP